MAKDKAIHNRLKSLSSAWKDTEARKSEPGLNDGDYVGRPSRMEVGESKNGRLQVLVQWKVSKGKMKGGTQNQYFGIEDEVGISFFKGFCMVMGIEIPEALTELPGVLEDFMENNNDEDFSFSVKTKEGTDFKNVYVKAPLADGEELEHAEEEEEDDDSKKKPAKKGKKPKPEEEEDDDSTGRELDVDDLLEEGKHVKITLKSGSSKTGTVTDVTDTAVTIEDAEDEEYEIPRKKIDTVELVKKKKR